MVFHDFRDPIEYVVEQYFQRKRSAESNKVEQNGKEVEANYKRNTDLLPQMPVEFIRNRDNKIYKFIYGNVKALQEDPYADVIIWQQEIINDDQGKYIGMLYTFPDGTEMLEKKEEYNGFCTGFSLE